MGPVWTGAGTAWKGHLSGSEQSRRVHGGVVRDPLLGGGILRGREGRNGETYTNEKKADRAEERRKLKEGSTWSSRKKEREERGDRDRETATEEGRM